jgi:putative acetyltransferase
LITSILCPGQRHSQLSLSNGDTAIIRSPEWRDLDGLTQYINGLVEEHAQIILTTPVTRESEAQWLGQRLSEIENGRMIMLVGDIRGRVASVGEVEILAGERAHTGYLGIGVSKNERGTGLGKGMMLALLELSKKMSLIIIILDVFATNTPAIRLYENVGFKEVGRIPKGILRDGNYIDLLRMTLQI